MDELFSNRWLWASVLASFSAQVLKVILIVLLERRLDSAKLVETGGMPSSHSAMVVALSTGIGVTQGVGSPLFAVAVVFSLIVMYDATGVRHASGEQARMLNLLVEELRMVVREGFAPKPLRVLLGHTYLEVIVGALLGAFIGFAVFVWF